MDTQWRDSALYEQNWGEEKEECCYEGHVQMAKWSLIRARGVWQEIQSGSLSEGVQEMGQM